MAKKQILLWLDEETVDALRAHAAERRDKISATADGFLRHRLGLTTGSPLGHGAPALSELEEMMRRVVAERIQHSDDWLAALLVKTLREAAMGRWLTSALLAHQCGPEVAADEAEQAAAAASYLMRAPGLPMPELEPLVERPLLEERGA